MRRSTSTTSTRDRISLRMWRTAATSWPAGPGRPAGAVAELGVADLAVAGDRERAAPGGQVRRVNLPTDWPE